MRQQNIKDAKIAHVRAANSTDKKIKGLTVQVRYYVLPLDMKYYQYFYTIIIILRYENIFTMN